MLTYMIPVVLFSDLAETWNVFQRGVLDEQIVEISTCIFESDPGKRCLGRPLSDQAYRY
jgi:hypothetical protein